LDGGTLANDYLNRTNRTLVDPILDEMKTVATKEQIPIISEEGIRLILHLIQIGKYCRVLEIGTAIGYTAYSISKFTSASVVTIERNPEILKRAKGLISTDLANNKITFIEADALEIAIESLGQFDVIFIDAAKAQYIRFFEKFESLLSKGGIVITDNLLFHGFVENPKSIISRNRKQLVGKINKFNQWLLEKNDYDSFIYEIGDGMAISYKK